MTRLNAPTEPGSIGSAPNGNGATLISGIRTRKNSAKVENSTITGQREGSRSPRPRQNSKAVMISIDATISEDSTTR